MNHSQLHAFLAQIGLMLAVAWAFGYLMRRWGQPVVLGELIGGILLGPTLLGTVAPEVYHGLFPADTTIATSADALLKVGMLFFMFAAGLEVNLVHFRQCKRVVALTSVMGGVLPFALGFGMVLLFPEFWGQSDRPLLLALFMGTALSISALPVIARILMDVDMIATKIGMTVMTSAMINDLIGWSLFALILRHLDPGGPGGNIGITLTLVLAYSALILGLGRWIFKPLLHGTQFFKDWPGGLLTFLSVLVILAAVGAEKIGIHAIFGAFLVGVAMGQDDDPGQDKRIHGMIQPFALNFFAPLYFVSVGLKANFASQFDGLLVLLVFLIACLGKILGAGLGARLGGMGNREALTVGVGLNARGAIEIILASVALEHRLIDQRLFVALVVMAFLTSLISGPLLQRLVSRSG
ncbi:MAG: cation:proton antiporter [Methylococcaceae bacterium]|nr:cation:proton antiporter [Methylococcaceae bacterium]